MTDIRLHGHPNVQWVSWRMGRMGFGRIHLSRPDSENTLCDAVIPASPARVVRNQFSASLEDICRSCLKEYAKGVRLEPDDAA